MKMFPLLCLVAIFSICTATEANSRMPDLRGRFHTRHQVTNRNDFHPTDNLENKKLEKNFSKSQRNQKIDTQLSKDDMLFRMLLLWLEQNNSSESPGHSREELRTPKFNPKSSPKNQTVRSTEIKNSSASSSGAITPLHSASNGLVESSCDYERKRIECGYPGITPFECKLRNCCWDHKIQNRSWCFHPVTSQLEKNEPRGGAVAFHQGIADAIASRSGEVNRSSANAHPQTVTTSEDVTTNASSSSMMPTPMILTSSSGALPQDPTLSVEEQNFLSSIHQEYRVLRTNISLPVLIPPPPPIKTTNTLLDDPFPRNTSGDASTTSMMEDATSLPQDGQPPQENKTKNSLKHKSSDALASIELAVILSILKKMETPVENPPSTPQECPLHDETSCCRLDPLSPCCEYRPEETPLQRAAPSTRIVGGSPAGTLGKSVVHLARLPSKTLICGGTLINSEWVLTAAHCVLEHCYNMRPASELLVSLGKYRKSPHTHDIGQQDRRVSDVICHPNQCKSSPSTPRLNDVALIRLDEPATINHFVSPALLPRRSDHPSLSRNCFALGWGGTRGSGFSDVLKQVSIPMIPNKKCNLPSWRNCAIRACMLCAGDINIDPCDGDSGGPLFCPLQNGVYVLQGVYSWGRCGRRARKPSVYSRTTYFLNWINNVVQRYSTSSR